MIDHALRRLLDAAAHLVGLPAWRTVSGPELLEGLILAESGGDPMATRYEGHQDQQADGDSRDTDDGAREDDRSYGLMQVMGTNLRAMVGVAPGVPMDFSWALRPAANLAFGLRHLCAEIDRAQRELEARRTGDLQHGLDVDLALARYNGGGRGNAVSDLPNLRNGGYVERVYEHAEKARADRKAVGWKVVG